LLAKYIYSLVERVVSAVLVPAVRVVGAEDMVPVVALEALAGPEDLWGL
jgi:hypothetical protein